MSLYNKNHPSNGYNVSIKNFYLGWVQDYIICNPKFALTTIRDKNNITDCIQAHQVNMMRHDSSTIYLLTDYRSRSFDALKIALFTLCKYLCMCFLSVAVHLIRTPSFAKKSRLGLKNPWWWWNIIFVWELLHQSCKKLFSSP